jgi:hypothetical protein
MTNVPRNTGIDPDAIAQTEADHLGNCPVCGALIDIRDFGQVLARMHDQKIETGQGPAPPKREGPVQ